MIAGFIHYERIGAFPEVESLRESLPNTIATYEASGLSAERAILGSKLVRAAEHFFGLVLTDFVSVRSLVDAMKSVDQELMVS